MPKSVSALPKWVPIVIAAAFLVLYGPVFVSFLIPRWLTDESVTHGWLVIPIAAITVWYKRNELASLPILPDPRGAFLVGLAILLHLTEKVLDLNGPSPISIPIYVAGAVLWIAGWQWLKALSFPIAYLLFMVPVPGGLTQVVSFPLRKLATDGSKLIAGKLGVEIYGAGMNLEFMQPRGTEYIRIIVADPCSGLHSLMAIKALHAITAYVSRLRTPWKWVLFFLALPITLAANICRMTLIILVCAFVDKKFGLTLFHDYSPYVLFLFVFLILIGIGQLMERWTGGNAWWKARKASGAFSFGPAAIFSPEIGKRIAGISIILAIASCTSSGLALYIGTRPPISAASADVASIPKEHLGWKSLGDIESDPETMKQIQADSYINRRYINSKGDVVDLMVVYRRYGRREFAHRPDQCFPAGGYIGVTNRVAALPWAGKDVPAVYWLFDGRAVLRPDGQTGVPMTTVTYFFASANRTEHDFIRQQLWMALERIFPNKNGWTFLRLSSPRVETDQRALDAQRAFMAAMEPEIRKVITTDEATAGAL